MPTTIAAAAKRLSDWAGGTGDTKKSRAQLQASFNHEPALFKRFLVTQEVLTASLDYQEKAVRLIAGIDASPAEKGTQCGLLRQSVAELLWMRSMVADDALMSALPKTGKPLTAARSSKLFNETVFASFLLYPSVDPQVWDAFHVGLPVDDGQLTGYALGLDSGKQDVTSEYLVSNTFLLLSCMAKLSGYDTSCDMSGMVNPSG